MVKYVVYNFQNAIKNICIKKKKNSFCTISVLCNDKNVRFEFQYLFLYFHRLILRQITMIMRFRKSM